MTIIERILSMAEKRGLKKSDIYTSCKIPQSTFSSWTINNVSSIPSEYVPKIADVFDVTCNELLTGDKSDRKLTEDEQHLISEFNRLDWDGQKVVLGVLISEKRRLEQASQPEG